MNPLLQCMHMRLTQFTDCHEQASTTHELSLADNTTATTTFAGATWEITTALSPVAERADAIDGQVTFRVKDGAACEVGGGA